LEKYNVVSGYFFRYKETQKMPHLHFCAETLMNQKAFA